MEWVSVSFMEWIAVNLIIGVFFVFLLLVLLCWLQELNYEKGKEEGFEEGIKGSYRNHSSNEFVKDLEKLANKYKETEK